MRLAVEQLATLRASDIATLREPIDVVHEDRVIAQIYPVKERRRRAARVTPMDPARIEAMKIALERLEAAPRIEMTEDMRREIEAIVGPLDLD